jgi:hypothetical protein
MATMRAMVADKPGDYDVMQLRDWTIPPSGPARCSSATTPPGSATTTT